MKIICIGRNYSEHARELGNEVPEEAVVFMKPDSAILRIGEPFFIPDWSDDIHYETEVVVRIDRIGKNIAERFAHKYYHQFGLGLDFTARDVQAKLKSKGLPWEKAKAFDRSAFISEWFDKSDFDLTQLDFSMKKNGTIAQKGNTSDMMRSIEALIAEVSKFFTLKIGDILFTGTPAGVGKVQAEDVLEGYIQDQKVFEVKVK
jgi:2-keto-4-pentenoate hydratase/2-oxohepta-3-ene-1,7-dioic acid hydratase in catechol pathway